MIYFNLPVAIANAKKNLIKFRKSYNENEDPIQLKAVQLLKTVDVESTIRNTIQHSDRDNQEKKENRMVKIVLQLCLKAMRKQESLLKNVDSFFNENGFAHLFTFTSDSNRTAKSMTQQVLKQTALLYETKESKQQELITRIESAIQQAS